MAHGMPMMPMGMGIPMAMPMAMPTNGGGIVVGVMPGLMVPMPQVQPPKLGRPPKKTRAPKQQKPPSQLPPNVSTAQTMQSSSTGGSNQASTVNNSTNLATNSSIPITSIANSPKMMVSTHHHVDNDNFIEDYLLVKDQYTSTATGQQGTQAQPVSSPPGAKVAGNIQNAKKRKRNSATKEKTTHMQVLSQQQQQQQQHHHHQNSATTSTVVNQNTTQVGVGIPLHQVTSNAHIADQLLSEVVKVDTNHHGDMPLVVGGSSVNPAAVVVANAAPNNSHNEEELDFPPAKRIKDDELYWDNPNASSFYDTGPDYIGYPGPHSPGSGVGPGGDHTGPFL